MAHASLPEPLERRLLFVTGKGGVGKTTVASAIGLLAARHGRRTLVAEVARRDDVWRALRAPGPSRVFEERHLGEGLHAISIDPEQAMEEYLRDQLPVRQLAEVLSSSRAFGYLAAATPGLREMLTVGKVWELSQPERRTPGARPYDLVVVDAPATGHGMAFLAAPRTFSAAAAMGPVARQARTIHEMLADRSRTAVLAVASPTEASITETIQLVDEVEHILGHRPARVVLNGMLPRRFAAADERTLDEAVGRAAGPGLARGALRSARSACRRQQAQAEQARRLYAALGVRPATLPYLFRPALGEADLRLLARLLLERL
jgi:anion-transporting  ArsA/GET3 family ATPase